MEPTPDKESGRKRSDVLVLIGVLAAVLVLAAALSLFLVFSSDDPAEPLGDAATQESVETPP